MFDHCAVKHTYRCDVQMPDVKNVGERVDSCEFLPIYLPPCSDRPAAGPVHRDAIDDRDGPGRGRGPGRGAGRRAGRGLGRPGLGGLGLGQGGVRYQGAAAASSKEMTQQGRVSRDRETWGRVAKDRFTRGLSAGAGDAGLQRRLGLGRSV
jgi:hypothetical protein